MANLTTLAITEIMKTQMVGRQSLAIWEEHKVKRPLRMRSQEFLKLQQFLNVVVNLKQAAQNCFC
jgi:hypothetical protein